MKRARIGLLLAIVLAAAGLSVTRNLVWEQELGTQLLWSKKDAYFFAARRRDGWSGNLLAYAWELSRNVAGLSRRPTHSLKWLEVTEFSLAHSARFVVPDTATLPLGVSADEIYAAFNGPMSKWQHGKFVEATDDEKTRLFATFRGGPFRDVDGWSREVNIVRRTSGNSTLTLQLDGHPITISIVRDEYRRSAVLDRGPNDKVTLIDLNTARAEVDRVRYDKLFGPLPQ
jgi:hypothetical protein